MKIVACWKCKSRKICFVQKQIENLAERMTQLPFLEEADLHATRTNKMFSTHDKQMCRRFDLGNELKMVIASYCTFFRKEPDDPRTA